MLHPSALKLRLLALLSFLILVLCTSQSGFAQWTQTATLKNQFVSAVGSIGSTLVVGTQGGLFRSVDNGTTWIASTNGFTGTTGYAFFASGSNLFVGSDSGIFVSTDFGVSWMDRSSGLTNKHVNVFTQNGSDLFAGGYGGVSRSTDEGVNWTNVTAGLPTAGILSLAALDNNIFSGSVAGVYRSSDRGANWTVENSGLVNHLAFALIASGQNLFVGTNAATAVSTNDGTNWTIDTAGISFTTVYSFAESGSAIFAGSFNLNGNIFLSKDRGAHWEAINTGLPGTLRPIYATAIMGSNVYIGTNGDGVWRRPLADFKLSVTPQKQPSTISLSCYPNPTHESATIMLSSADHGYARVAIVNVLGEEVATLFSGQLNSVKHSFNWNAKGMPQGTYFCQVRGSSEVKQLPIILSR